MSLHDDSFNETVANHLSASRFNTEDPQPSKRQRVSSALCIPPGLSCSGQNDPEDPEEYSDASTYGGEEAQADDSNDQMPSPSDYVIVVYDTWYLGQVGERSTKQLTIHFMESIGENR